MIPDFKNPEDIRQYGLIINAFDQAAKYLTQHIIEFSPHDPQSMDMARRFGGEGAYNSYAIHEFTRFGPQQMDAFRKKDRGGLFGAFPLIHRPELQISQALPALLAEQGYHLTLASGKQVPLSALSFDFSPGSTRDSNSGARSQRGALMISQVKADYAAQLPEGTVLIKGREWADSGIKLTDASGKPVRDDMAALLLWLHVGATKGLKRQGVRTPGAITLMSDGPDDDFNAENILINVLQHLKNDHQTDLMPKFADYVRKVKQDIELPANRYVLNLISAIIQLDEYVQDKAPALEPIFAKQNYEEESIAAHLREVTAFLGLTLPAALPEDLQPERLAQQFQTIAHRKHGFTAAGELETFLGHAQRHLGKCPTAFTSSHEFQEVAQFLGQAIERLGQVRAVPESVFSADFRGHLQAARDKLAACASSRLELSKTVRRLDQHTLEVYRGKHPSRRRDIQDLVLPRMDMFLEAARASGNDFEQFGIHYARLYQQASWRDKATASTRTVGPAAI